MQANAFWLIALASFAGVVPAATAQEVSQHTPPAFDPVGLYDFEATTGRGIIEGRMKIIESEDGYGGTITPNGDSSARITSLAMDGSDMVIHATMERGELVLEISFTGDEFVGTYDGAPGQGDFNGRKLRR